MYYKQKKKKVDKFANVHDKVYKYFKKHDEI